MIAIGRKAAPESVVAVVAQSQGSNQRRACLGAEGLGGGGPAFPRGEMGAAMAFRSLMQVPVPQSLPPESVKSLLAELAHLKLSAK